MKQKYMTSERERDGIKMPYSIKELEFNPPADLAFI